MVQFIITIQAYPILEQKEKALQAIENTTSDELGAMLKVLENHVPESRTTVIDSQIGEEYNASKRRSTFRIS